jgi:hypothetical protein
MGTERADQRLRRRLIADMWARGRRKATAHLGNGFEGPLPFSDPAGKR